MLSDTKKVKSRVILEGHKKRQLEKSLDDASNQTSNSTSNSTNSTVHNHAQSKRQRLNEPQIIDLTAETDSETTSGAGPRGNLAKHTTEDQTIDLTAETDSENTSGAGPRGNLAKHTTEDQPNHVLNDFAFNNHPQFNPNVQRPPHNLCMPSTSNVQVPSTFPLMGQRAGSVLYPGYPLPFPANQIGIPNMFQQEANVNNQLSYERCLHYALEFQKLFQNTTLAQKSEINPIRFKRPADTTHFKNKPVKKTTLNLQLDPPLDQVLKNTEAKLSFSEYLKEFHSYVDRIKPAGSPAAIDIASVWKKAGITLSNRLSFENLHMLQSRGIYLFSEDLISKFIRKWTTNPVLFQQGQLDADSVGDRFLLLYDVHKYLPTLKKMLKNKPLSKKTLKKDKIAKSYR